MTSRNRTPPASPFPSPALEPLAALAYDLRWSWKPEIRALFASIDAEGWRRSRGNPVALLRSLSPAAIERLARDSELRTRAEALLRRASEDDAEAPSHAGARELRDRGERIAYFSAEFGLTEALPIYSGGLGILAGDHMKAASDLRAPVDGVGIFYREGYFHQTVDPEGRQHEDYPRADPDDLPLRVPAGPDGGAPTVRVAIAGRPVTLLVRGARVGAVELFLLDADLPDNLPEDREITRRLYGGDREMRLKQEIVLGVGGLRALHRLGRAPAALHLNEGHAAFVTLERIRQLTAEEGLPFEAARELAAAQTVFTTHTPVPAGIDVFPRELLEPYLAPLAREIGISFDDLFALGLDPGSKPAQFSMAVLALRLSSAANGVSKLHARVSRRMWSRVWPAIPEAETPIAAITNGVHRETWTDPAIQELSEPDLTGPEGRSELWRRHGACRRALVSRCREIVGDPNVLDPEALTIGFARRFATYKRAGLLFRDPRRLAGIAEAPSRPVQFVFAGKAHPRDEEGKRLLERIAVAAARGPLHGRVVFLPGYDMAMARMLVAGCDVWLNTPERPLEASGTSGMKAGMNGTLNLSVRDGWWAEAPEQIGFSIGPDRDHAPEEAVAEELYRLLEQQVVPLFYDRSTAGEPEGWIDRMVRSSGAVARRFSAERMISEYLDRAYLPVVRRSQRLGSSRREPLLRLVSWKGRVARLWPSVAIEKIAVRENGGSARDVEVRIHLGSLSPSEVAVECRSADESADASTAAVLEPERGANSTTTFRGTFWPARPDSLPLIRVRPDHPDLARPLEMGLFIESCAGRLEPGDPTPVKSGPVRA